MPFLKYSQVTLRDQMILSLHSFTVEYHDTICVTITRQSYSLFIFKVNAQIVVPKKVKTAF